MSGYRNLSPAQEANKGTNETSAYQKTRVPSPVELYHRASAGGRFCIGAKLREVISAWPLSVVYRVMLTLVLPGIVTVALFAFFSSWNEFLAALIFMTDSSKYTLPILLLNAQSGLFGSIDWGALQAGVAIAMFPCLVLFLLLQKYYISGLVAGSVKG